MLAIITFLFGLLGLWINLYSLFAVGFFAAYYFLPGKKSKWELLAAFAGLILAAFNFVLVVITGLY